MCAAPSYVPKRRKLSGGLAQIKVQVAAAELAAAEAAEAAGAAESHVALAELAAAEAAEASVSAAAAAAAVARQSGKVRTTSVVEVAPGVWQGRDYKLRFIETTTLYRKQQKHGCFEFSLVAFAWECLRKAWPGSKRKLLQQN